MLLDAYSQVTQVPEKFTGFPAGMRGMQLPDTAVKSYFLTAFGRPVRQQARESERTSVPTITQALHIINGETLNDKLRVPGNSIDMLIRLGFSDEQIVDYLYLASFSRRPTAAERSMHPSAPLLLKVAAKNQTANANLAPNEKSEPLSTHKDAQHR